MKIETQNLVLGVDGCRGGWLVVSWDGKSWNHRVVRDRLQLIDLLKSSRRTFIDIPIGLGDLESSRTCDRLLRKTLGRSYSSSVFSPPVRAAIYANSYENACQINQAQTGKKISIQSWNITAKIRQIDEIFQQQPELGDRILESHPELLFWKLNQEQSLTHKKKTDAGKQQRLKLLTDPIAESQKLFTKIRNSSLKKEVSDDDILDAIVLAYSSHQSLVCGLKSFPDPVEFDDRGLRMAIHYY
ncbi:DUF429 domain-containing protein [Oscillatoriales cyanobacterium LEGE 11467]|uniref:DUF429 domain-containing protein n=1 Tax=Zarconia navalis LEGE 11467 TaxID=1828826 RepID=A0A928VXI4_9CYAN|nr:DUF429 domain-containing protein [Zarconia navalis]MBE9041429.1 DUF429 domain-containing protein [Zarconia navalis LEGE 11467]